MCYEQRYFERWKARATRRTTKARETERSTPAAPLAPSPASVPQPRKDAQKIERELEEIV